MMSSSLIVNCSPRTGKKTFEYSFKIIFFPMFRKKMENLCESYATVKNWTRTSHKNVNKFYEALGLEQEEDDTNKKLAINFYAGQWYIKTNSPHSHHSTQVKQTLRMMC